MYTSSLVLPLLTLTAAAAASPLQFPFLQTSTSAADSTASTSVSESSSSRLVPLTLGVMSRCPDAEICETLIDRVLDSHTTVTLNTPGQSSHQVIVGDLVRLNLVYLAKEEDRNEGSYGNLTCLHGPLECRANVQQLCAAAHWSRSSPSSSSMSTTWDEEGDDDDKVEEEGFTAEKGHGEWKTWWNFVQCMNYGRRDRIGDVSTAKACAKVVGREWTDELEECAKDSPDSEGAKLFRKSVARSKKLDVEKSCTIVLNSRKICVHDGTWKECSNGHEVGDFVAQIKDEYKRLNTPAKRDDAMDEEGWVMA